MCDSKLKHVFLVYQKQPYSQEFVQTLVFTDLEDVQAHCLDSNLNGYPCYFVQKFLMHKSTSVVDEPEDEEDECCGCWLCDERAVESKENKHVEPKQHSDFTFTVTTPVGTGVSKSVKVDDEGYLYVE